MINETALDLDHGQDHHTTSPSIQFRASSTDGELLDSADPGRDRVSDEGIRSVSFLVADPHLRPSAFDSLCGHIYAAVWSLVSMDNICSVQ